MLATLMCEVESRLNQIPVTYVSDDVNNDEWLTPNHFPIGESDNFSPTECSDQNVNLRKIWKVVQAAIVSSKSDNVPRSHWLLPRITNTLTGRDNIVRTVELKNPNLVLVRQARKFCLRERVD